MAFTRLLQEITIKLNVKFYSFIKVTIVVQQLRSVRYNAVDPCNVWKLCQPHNQEPSR